jgi:hypothetical protein
MRRLTTGRNAGRRVAMVRAVLAAVGVVLVLAATVSPVAGQLEGTGAFVIEKVLVGDFLLRGPVTIAVSCTNGREETITFAPGVFPTEQVIGGLAPGTTCTVTEPENGLAPGLRSVTTTIDPPEIVADPSVTPVVRVVNTYIANPIVATPPAGALIITKLLEGDDALRGDIQIRVQCAQLPDFGGGTFDRTETIPAGVDPVPPLVFAPIPAPADCLVTETVTGASGAVDVDVIGETTVRVNPNEDLQLTLTNVYAANMGSLRVRKIIDGPGAALRGDVELSVSCTDGTEATLTVPAGQASSEQTVAPIVATSTCTVTEVGSGNGAIPGVVDVATTFTPAPTVTIAEGVESVIQVENTYTPVPTTLEIIKEVAGPAAGLQGPVQIDVSCDGQPTESFDVPSEAPAGTIPLGTLTVPFGTSCAVTEIMNGDNASVDVTTGFVPGPVVDVAGPTTVTVTNTYTVSEPPAPAPASLTVGKTITGAAAADHGLIAILVDCGPEHRALLTIPAGDMSAAPVVVDGLPAPITCNVIEVLDGSTDTVNVTTTVVPPGPVTLEPDEDETVTVTDDYQFRPGTLVLTKVITGGAAAQRDDIEITALCGAVVGTFDIPAGTQPTPFTLEGIAPGTSCTIEEIFDGSTPAVAVATSPQLPITTAPVDAGGTLAVTITNDYTLLTGTLLVSKEVSGPAADSRGDITLTVSCTDDTFDSVTFPAGSPPTVIEVGPLPFGTTCTVAEPDSGAISGEIDVVGPTFVPGADVTIDDEVEVVTVRNSYHFAPDVTLVKEFSGPAAEARAPVRLRLRCGPRIAVINSPPDPATVTIEEVPAGTVCTVTELNNGAIPGIAVTTTFDPSSQIVAGETEVVTVTNVYNPVPTGNLLVESILTGPAEPRRTTVQVTVTCDSGRTITLTVPAGSAPDPALVGGLPSGTRCTIEQPLDGDTPSILTATSGLPAGPVDVVVDEVTTVEIANVYTDPLAPPTPMPPPTPGPSPSPAPKPGPAPAPAPSGSGEAVAATGADVQMIVIGAITLVGIGVGLRSGERRWRVAHRPRHHRRALDRSAR